MKGRKVRSARAWAVAMTLSVLAVACSPAPPALSDPREILDRAVAHLAAAETVHLDATVDGTLGLAGFLGTPASSGSRPSGSVRAGALALTGTHVEGDLDLAGSRAVMRFQVPALLGLTGEVRQLGEDAYLRSSLTSRGWHRLGGADLPLAIGQPLQWLEGLVAWLARPAVVPARLDDSSCRLGRCYVVQVAADASDLSALASAAPDLAASLSDTRMTVDLRIEQASLVVSEATLRVDLGADGAITISIAFSSWDAPVAVEAPKPSEIVSGPLLP